ncbi:hypothetical protein FGL98_00010 [Leekyejoonella antrihumi]|uniref:Molybdopterin oxidoreductase domain-containing protein n=1 Tax=Leekyejoonella antrihumi TaxID=1660198 RepID=A0A563E937_9MICO|nr:hypothetical protein FGL98_00010 [Leekyejoonella antrihumi]
MGQPKDWAAGVPGVTHSMGPGLSEMGMRRGVTGLLALNQKDGFDCMSCAWPDPEHRKTAEFCENGAKALTWEATPLVVPESFWAEHSIDDLLGKTDYWLGQQGRLTDPVYKPVGKDHYEPISWEKAFEVIADELNALESPNEAAFYTSGQPAAGGGVEAVQEPTTAAGDRRSWHRPGRPVSADPDGG